jgi:hypothetical protein
MARSTARGRLGREPQGWIWWFDFMTSIGQSAEQHAELSDGPEARNRVEGFLMRCLTWLVDVRGVTPETARKYMSEAMARHEAEFGPMVPGYSMPRLKKLQRGMDETIEVPPRRPRRPMRTQVLRDAQVKALSGGSRLEANMRACTSTGFCGLLRAAEMALQPGETFTPSRHLTRDDVLFCQGGVWLRFSELRVGQPVEAARVMMRPCKKLRYRAGKTVPVVLYDGTVLSPVQDLLHLFRVDGVPSHLEGVTPLFRRQRNEAFTTTFVRTVVRYLVSAVGLEPSLYGGHSLRIGGATAALAAGLSASVIRVMGRWDSDVFELYARASADGARRAGTVIASTSFEDFEGMFNHEEFVPAQG